MTVEVPPNGYAVRVTSRSPITPAADDVQEGFNVKGPKLEDPEKSATKNTISRCNSD